MHEYDNAIADFNEALRLSPNDFVFVKLANRGETYADMCHYNEAISDSTESIRLSPLYPSPHATRGRAGQARKSM